MTMRQGNNGNPPPSGAKQTLHGWGNSTIETLPDSAFAQPIPPLPDDDTGEGGTIIGHIINRKIDPGGNVQPVNVPGGTLRPGSAPPAHHIPPDTSIGFDLTHRVLMDEPTLPKRNDPPPSHLESDNTPPASHSPIRLSKLLTVVLALFCIIIFSSGYITEKRLKNEKRQLETEKSQLVEQLEAATRRADSAESALTNRDAEIAKKNEEIARLRAAATVNQKTIERLKAGNKASNAPSTNPKKRVGHNGLMNPW
jgi:hypothetical protein